MKKLQCSCGRFYEEDKTFCPFCGKERLFYDGTDVRMFMEKVPAALLVFAIINMIVGSILSLVFWLFCVFYIIIALILFVRSIIWISKRARRKGIAIATNIIAGGELIVGTLIILFMIIFA